MQDTTNEKTSDRIVSPGVGWTILLSLTFGLTLTWWTSLFLMMVGHDLPTGKIVFGSECALIGWFVLFAAVIPLCRFNQALPPAWILWICVAACTVALGTVWLWADMVDGASSLLFVMAAYLYRRYALHGKPGHGWILFYFAGSFALLTNTDKVFAYPDRGWLEGVDGRWLDPYYLVAYLWWAAIHCYALCLLLQKHYKPWALVAAALFVIYFPVVELPGDLARQYIGRWLTGPIDNTFYEKYRGLYYTKIRPNQVWVLTCPSDYQSVKSFVRTSGGVYKLKDGSMLTVPNWGQTLRTPGLALWINDHVILPLRNR